MKNAKLKIFNLICVAVLCALTTNAQSSLNLSREQKTNLDESVPAKVRNFLETADKFEIFMHARKENGKLVAAMDRELRPNIKAEITEKKVRLSVLDSFYLAGATDEMGASCYLPSHLIRAGNANEIVQIEICFGCRKFYGSGTFGKFSGTLSGEAENAQAIINKIIEQTGTDIK